MNSILLCSTLIWLSAPATTPPPDDYAIGVRALKQKRAADAITALQRCVDKQPQRYVCHWELGWAFYLEGRWQEVVHSWKQVKALNPQHAEVDKHLASALAQLEAQNMAQEMARTAPASLPAVPSGSGLRIRAVGDIMLGTDFPTGYLSPGDGADVMESVNAVLVDADLTFANLEGPLCDSGETDKCKPGQNCYAFRSPTRYGSYLQAAGIDVVSTANNHAEDFGVECRLETEATLKRLGIGFSGRPGTLAHLEHNGLQIGLIGFHTSRTGHYLNDHDAAAELVRGLAATNPIVIVSFHGGAEGSRALHVVDGEEEFLGENRGDLRRFAHSVVDAGADLVIGHGPHVLRGFEVYKGRLIAYSLGNFATYGRFNLSGNLGVGAVVEVNLDSDGRFQNGRIFSTKQQGQGIVSLDEQNRAQDLVRRLSRSDFPETGVVIARDGSFTAPASSPRHSPKK